MARALTAAGAPCGHEAAFTARGHGDCDWVAESSWLAAPYLDRLDGVYVVHLVRDPLKTIASRAATPTFRPRLSGHGRFAVHHAPDILRGHGRVERSAWHWVCWTRIITEGRPDEVLRVEDVTADDVTRLARLAVADAPGITRLPAPANTAKRPLPQVGWDRVSHVPGLADAAASYGYEVDQ